MTPPRWFASIKLTVFCLFWLAVLTFWGTLYQVDHGIYQAQARFFDSILLFAWGFLPLPGGMLTMGLLFVNLLGSFFVHYQAGWRMPGLMLIHLGLLLLLLGGFFTKITGIETTLSLLEGEGSNVALSREHWELAIWEHPDAVREVRAVDKDDLREGRSFKIDDSGLRFTLTEAHRNALPLQVHPQAGAVPVERPASPSGIDMLKGKKLETDPAGNMPGLVLEVEGAKDVRRALLFGGDRRPLILELPEGGARFLSLRRKRYELPLFMELEDFRREYYPGSEIPKDYRSLVNVHLSDDLVRKVVIKMNEPFRLGGWTFYQQSFAVLDDGEESVFAVTRNFGRLVPYWGTGITSLGLAMHFIQMQLLAIRRRRKTA